MTNETGFDRKTVEEWIADDPDRETAEEIKGLLGLAQKGDAGASAELADRFSGLLEFGTAGLRGSLGGGPNRMNRAVVLRAAAGLSGFLAEELPDGFTVVVGYDARRGSKQFALDTASVVEASGGHALLFDKALPTPVTAFALRHLNADAAVVVTASHNPPEDNGYKVYLGGRVVMGAGQGAQIVAPYDTKILNRMLAVPSVASIPRADDGWDLIGDEVVDAYVERIKEIVPRGARNVKIVLTSLHGVGGEIAVRALTECGFTDVHAVEEQHKPDPLFPTVQFPNPEEPGALDLAIDLANKVDADLILANDPDADRSSAALPDDSAKNGWRQLSGDEVGTLLGEQKAREVLADPNVDPETVTIANSVVSSRLLGQVARDLGLRHRETLTGFKWISRVPGLVFGYEEALGYCVDPDYVRDKDGISAGTKLAALAAKAKADGSNLQDRSDELAIKFGLYATAPLTMRVDDLSLLAKGMQNLRSRGIEQIAGFPVVETVDLREGTADLPPTDALIYKTARNDRVMVRPSGTEPKLKCYIEVIEPVRDHAVSAARVRATQRLEEIKLAMRPAIGI